MKNDIVRDYSQLILKQYDIYTLMSETTAIERNIALV